MSDTDNIVQESPVPKTRRKLRKGGAKFEAHPKTIDDPVLNRSVAIPQSSLPITSDTKALTKQVNALQNVVLTLTAVVSQYRELFRAERRSTEVDLDIVFRLAARGCNQTTICELLGIKRDLMAKRQDLIDAYTQGRAELKNALFSKQIETAMSGGMAGCTMQIFLGKQLLEQKPDSALSVNVAVVNTADGSAELRKKIAEQHMRLRDEARAEFESVVDADVVELPVAMVEECQEG